MINFKIKTIEQTDKKLILQSDMLWFAWVMVITQTIGLIGVIYSTRDLNTILRNSCKQETILNSDRCQKILNSKTFDWNNPTGKALFCALPLWFIFILVAFSQIKSVRCEIDKNIGDFTINCKSILKTTEETHLIKDIVEIALDNNNPLSPIIFNLLSDKKVKIDFFILELESKLKAFAQIQDFLN